MNNLRSYIIGGTIVAVAAILVLVYFVAFNKPAAAPITNNTTHTPVNANSNTDTNEATTKTYTNSAHGFSFKYPKILKSGSEDFTFIPTSSGNDRVTLESQFVYEINTEYCAPSGECRPTTQNLGFGVSVINRSISTLRSQIEFPLTTKTFGKTTVYTMNQGVEGEGINYYFISLNNTQTLMFDQRYIDENILVGYQTVQDFIPFSEQNKIMEFIITSLTLTK